MEYKNWNILVKNLFRKQNIKVEIKYREQQIRDMGDKFRGFNIRLINELEERIENIS